MKPCETKSDYDKNPIRILELMGETDKRVKPQEVFVGFKAPQKSKKKCVKVCPKGNKVCHCSKKNLVSKVPKGSHRMSDGSIMKDKDMKKKTKSKY
tara:strand:- start:3966 stop:4253 length:288 start_codon:yes stop_codon:yes gene_type:complete